MRLTLILLNLKWRINLSYSLMRIFANLRKKPTDGKMVEVRTPTLPLGLSQKDASLLRTVEDALAPWTPIEEMRKAISIVGFSLIKQKELGACNAKELREQLLSIRRRVLGWSIYKENELRQRGVTFGDPYS